MAPFVESEREKCSFLREFAVHPLLSAALRQFTGRTDAVQHYCAHHVPHAAGYRHMQQEPMLEQGYIGRLIHLARPLSSPPPTKPSPRSPPTPSRSSSNPRTSRSSTPSSNTTSSPAPPSTPRTSSPSKNTYSTSRVFPPAKTERSVSSLDYNIRGQTLIQYSVQDQSQPGINSSNISPNRQLEHDSPLSSSSILLAVKQKVAPLSQCVVSSFQLASPCNDKSEL